MLLFLLPTKVPPPEKGAGLGHHDPAQAHRAESHFPKAEDGQGGPNLEPTSSRVAMPIPRHHCPLWEVAQV